MFNIFKKDIGYIIQKKGEGLCKKYVAFHIAEGNKIKDGQDTGQKSIVFFVYKKLSKSELPFGEFIPKKIYGHLTDVVEEEDYAEPMSGISHRGRVRPIWGGISSKVEGGSACSLGIVCYKNGRRGAILNEHCAHNRQDRTGKKIIQPSPSDRGTIQDAIGTIIYPPIITNKKVNKIDSIFIPLDVESELKVRRIDNYTKKWVDPQIGMKFFLPNRTTDFTEGVITHINVLAQVNFRGDLGIVKFYPCVFARQKNFNIVSGGSSGSVAFDEHGNAIMQTFAASSDLAIFIPFKSVVEELGIELEEPKKEIGFIAVNRGWFSDSEILVNSLNFRSSPKIDNNVIRKLSRGERFQIIEYGGWSNGWHFLKVEA